MAFTLALNREFGNNLMCHPVERFKLISDDIFDLFLAPSSLCIKKRARNMKKINTNLNVRSEVLNINLWCDKYPVS